KDVFADDFKVGAALSTAQVMGEEPKSLDLAGRQVNTITPENLLKWDEVHPEPDQYNFEPADRYVEWGEKHGMFIVGHCLVWHNQTPPWAFRGDGDKPLDRAASLARIKAHIDAVVVLYKVRVGGGDVVNEAIDEEGR